MRGLHQLLNDSAEQFGNRHCLSQADGTTIDYNELNRRSDRIADMLRESGLQQGQRVAIYGYKRIGFVEAIFGILKAGGAYIPLPSDSPPERNAFIIDNCQVDLLIAEDHFADSLRALPEPGLQALIELDGDWKIHRVKRQFRSEAAPGLAYILYTSGSTGKPKGVTFTHQNALSFVDWCSDVFQPDETKVFSSHASFHFDLSILDLYLCIKHGAHLVIFDEKTGKNPMALAHAIQEFKITNWYSTPTILKLMLQYGKLDRYDCSSLETVLFAGEVFHGRYLRELKNAWPKPLYYNLYGPTETNVCTWFRIPDQVPEEREAPYPIGKVCEHLQGLLLPTSDRQGELCIAGPAVTSGYWQLPERNASAWHTDEKGKAWYKTGDIVELDDAGDYVFIDRVDRMVKRRGFRIELGEVEAAVHRHPEVNDAAVIAYLDENKDTLIKAYLQAAEGSELNQIALKTFCSKELPMYMIPDAFELMERIPKTGTDKTDYQQLKRLNS